MEVGYISFSFHLFKVKFRETLLSYVIYPFFISMQVHKFKSILRVPSVDVLIALVTSALVIAVTKFEREGFVRIS